MKKKEEDSLYPFSLTWLISKILSNLCKWSYDLALSTNSTNYINKAIMIIVYVLSVSHSNHMHKEWERVVSTLSTNYINKS